MKDLLFEIGCEDLPPLQIAPSVRALAQAFEAQAKALRLEHGEISTFATPRRLCIWVKNLAETQRDLEEIRIGPPVSAAYDAQGQPTRALLGFLKKHNPNDLIRITQKKRKKEVEYLALKVREKGAPTSKLLPNLLSQLPSNIHWKKAMRWGTHAQPFGRPVHWILALFGSEHISCRFGEIHSSTYTYGHPFHHPEPIFINAPDQYLPALERARVIPSVQKRRQRIESLIDQAVKDLGPHAHWVKDPELLDEITALVEWPVAIRGTLEEYYLQLPQPVLITSMKKHQRYFSVVDTEGHLLPFFITIANTEVRNPEVVARGNERVLRARLEDALFFFKEDQKYPLDHYAEMLKRVAYLRGLGSLWDKSLRIQKLATWLLKQWQWNEIKTEVQRAARLAKADLSTLMVSEFPELQGFMGGVYAQLAQEPTEVYQGIAEHYLPKNPKDKLPQSRTGTLLSLADRMDSIVALFALKKKPTGAADPFALRRQALGLIRILWDRQAHFSLMDFIHASVQTLDPSLRRPSLKREVYDFIATRLKHDLKEKYALNVIDAVLNISLEIHDFSGILGRIKALDRWVKSPDFEPIAVAFKRVANILKKSPWKEGDVQSSLFIEPAELKLWEWARDKKIQLERALQNRDFESALQCLVALRPAVDQFFDQVMVNVDDLQLRQNRHLLLRSVLDLFRQLADVRRL